MKSSAVVDFQELHQSQQSYPHQVTQDCPEYVEVDGQRIYVAGLDYSMYQQNKQKNNPNSNPSLLSELKNKITHFQQKKGIVHKIKKTENPKDSDQLTRKIVKAIAQNNNTNSSYANLEKYYEFDTRPQFGFTQPKTIMRRVGKWHIQSIYVNISEELIQKFNKLILQSHKQQSDVDQSMHNQSAESDDKQTIVLFSIFNDVSSDKVIKQKKKLDFGIADSQIFSCYYQQNNKKQIIKDRDEQIDKYQFMRKKVKKNIDETEYDGYGECYAENGPTLQEMKELKKQGIQLFGDAREFKQKEKKTVNVTKEYQKVKKIIQQKFSK